MKLIGINFCPECVAEGKDSQVFPEESTLMNPNADTRGETLNFYDEQGEHHFHSPRIYKEATRCSNHHMWYRFHGDRCFATQCDWGNELSFSQPRKMET